MQAFGYVRVSGKGQVEGDGLVRQEEAIKQYATLHGIMVERIFRDEGVSGTLESRPALADLFVSLEKNGHGIRTVIIERVDRLARDLMVQEAIINDLQRKDFNLVSVHEGQDLLSGDPTRTMIRQILGAVAQYDKSMTVMKLRAARDRKRVLKGKCEGRKSYPDAAPEIITEIKRFRKKPRGGRRPTYEAIADALNMKGMTSLCGRPFTPGLVRRIAFVYTSR
ncbi:MAG: recombinase family protein [Syntrophobacteraceae bacterium]